MSALLELKKATFSYEQEEVLHALELVVEEGSFVCVLGHNGCGKSTLAKLFNGILVPTQGQVLVDGLDTRQEENLLDIHRKVGMVFQNPDNQLVSNVVEEDVAFALENLGVPSEEIRHRVDEALALVDMTQYAAHAPHLLSGGQKQRVAIAGVIAMRPQCIVLDEPTAMLDPQGRREVLETICRLNREQGITIVLITHHMDEAALADRLLVMHQGQVELDGTPKTIFSQVEQLKALGLEVPETVELAWRLRQRGLPLSLDHLSVEECAQAIAQLLGKQNEIEEKHVESVD